jgi:hypothetical protein
MATNGLRPGTQGIAVERHHRCTLSVRPGGDSNTQADLMIQERPMAQIVAFSREHAQALVSLTLPIQQSEFDIPISLEAQPDLQAIAGFCTSHIPGHHSEVSGRPQVLPKNGFHEIPKAGLPEQFPIMAVDTRFYALALGRTDDAAAWLEN